MGTLPIALAAGGCRQVVAVCTGALILQAVGLRAGRRATTHWQFLDPLRSSGDVTVTEDRFARDGKIWTAAEVSAGIDVALALVADQAGEDMTGHVQLAMEYHPSARRYGQAHVTPEAPGYLKTGGAASSALNVSTVKRHSAHTATRRAPPQVCRALCGHNT
jgi:transcriptional regulator GlxA family with amidase domain